MATKKVTAVIKLQCPAGAATPAPPIGPALGPHGVSAPKFVQEFNDRTKSMEKGLVIPVVITIRTNLTHSFLKLLQQQFLLRKLVNSTRVQETLFVTRLQLFLRKTWKKSLRQRCQISMLTISKQQRKSLPVLLAVWV